MRAVPTISPFRSRTWKSNTWDDRISMHYTDRSPMSPDTEHLLESVLERKINE